MEAIQPADIGNGGGHGTIEPAAEPDDLCLIRRYTEHGDREAMGVLFDRHKDVAYRTAWRFMRSTAEAEDAVQTAFVKIMARTPSFIRGLTARAWILTVVANTCRDIIRSNQRRRCREKTAEEQREPMQTQGRDAGAELASMLKRMLDQIPDRYRLPIWLHHGEGLPFGEVSAALSVPEATLRSQTKRGLEMLRTRLAQAGASLPMTSILAVFPQVPVENAPASLTASIPDIVRGLGAFSQDVLAARAAAVGKVGTAVGVRVAAIAIAVVVAAGAIGTAVYLARTEKPIQAIQSPAAVPVAAGEILYRWDFDTPEPPKGLHVLEGKWRYVPGGGADGSGAMEMEGETVLVEMDVPIEKLPVEVVERVAVVDPLRPENNVHWTRVLWWPSDEIVQFTGLQDVPRASIPMSASLSPWRDVRHFVTERSVVRHTDGRTYDIMLFTRQPGAKLMFRVWRAHRIDSLEIRSVKPEELPDIRPYVEAVEKILPEQRQGTVRIPGLKPGPTRDAVYAQFLRPNE